MSTDLEQAIMGCIIKSKKAATYALGKLNSEDFTKGALGEVFQTMQEMIQEKVPIELISLSEKLKEKGLLTKIGGASYIASLSTFGLESSIEHYCESLKEKTRRRKLDRHIKLALQGLQDGQAPEEITSELQKGIGEILAQGNVKNYELQSDYMFKYLEILEERRKKKGRVSWGWKDLDVYGMLMPKRVYYVGARPAMGKTAFAMSLIHNVASQGYPVYFASMEMSNEQITDRSISMITGIDGQLLQAGALKSGQWDHVAVATARLHHMPVCLDDERQTTGELKIKAHHYKQEMLKKAEDMPIEKAEKIKQVGGLGLIVVDYFQLFKNPLKGMRIDEWTQIVSGELVEISKELNCPVVCLTQLNRENEKRADKRPQMSDMRGGGAQEQDAWVVMLLHRDEYYKPTQENKEVIEIIIAKNRSGPVGTVKRKFKKEETKII